MKKSVGVILAIVWIFIGLLLADRIFTQTRINTIATVAYKKFVPVHSADQSMYALFVVRGEHHWLFRVPQTTFESYTVGEQVRLQTEHGFITGTTYSTTLHSSSYVYE